MVVTSVESSHVREGMGFGSCSSENTSLSKSNFRCFNVFYKFITSLPSMEVTVCRYNQKSDMWAMGCVLYEMLTLRKVFDATVS